MKEGKTDRTGDQQSPSLRMVNTEPLSALLSDVSGEIL